MSHTQQHNVETYVETGSLSEEDYHRLMAVRRRRTTLTVLAELSLPVDLDDIAAAIAEREKDMAGSDETSIDEIVMKLHHIHLPKMDHLGVIDYDQDSNRVVAWS